MVQEKTINDIFLPMAIVNWIMGCGGIIEYPLGLSHLTLSYTYPSVCLLNYCLVIYLSVISFDGLFSKYYASDIESYETLIAFLVCSNVVSAISTIMLSWRRRKVRFCRIKFLDIVKIIYPFFL